jgi:hypothetical protein
MANKQNLQKQRNEVDVAVTYECGACASVARRQYHADPDGTLFVPDMYCGRCTKSRSLRPMSVSYTQIVVKSTEEWAELNKRAKELVDAKPQTRADKTPPAKKEATESRQSR